MMKRLLSAWMNMWLPVPDNSAEWKVTSTETKDTQTSLEDNPDYNDCELIVLDCRNINYAELIEKRLKTLGLKVDLLIPNEDVTLDRVLENISARGCLYAILVTNQNEQDNRITVKMLKEQAAEHSNLPVDAAIQLIVRDFWEQMAPRAARKPVLTGAKPVDAMKGSQVAPQLEPRTIDIIASMNSLLDKSPLTVLQYDYLINYLEERRNEKLAMEQLNQNQIQ